MRDFNSHYTNIARIEIRTRMMCKELTLFQDEFLIKYI
jgi:hypothetical protein